MWWIIICVYEIDFYFCIKKIGNLECHKWWRNGDNYHWICTSFDAVVNTYVVLIALKKGLPLEFGKYFFSQYSLVIITIRDRSITLILV